MSIQSEVRALEEIGVEVPPLVVSLASRFDSSSSEAVAIIGLFTRGKSRLLNDLAGATVSEVGANPTTAILLQIRSGADGASAESVGGNRIGLPADPDGFRSAVAEFTSAGSAGLHSAVISGRFRIPEGVVLLDTPGVGAESDLDEIDWWTGGGGSAVLVTSVPPGVSDADVRLYNAAREVFGDRLEVVIKPTDSAVERDDLVASSEAAAMVLGRAPMVVPAIPPTGAWGQGDGWGDLERRISELAQVPVNADAKDYEELDFQLARLTIEFAASLADHDLAALPDDFIDSFSVARSNLLTKSKNAAIIRLEEAAAIKSQQRARELKPVIQQRKKAGTDLLAKLKKMTLTSPPETALALADKAEAWLPLLDDMPELSELKADIEGATLKVRQSIVQHASDELYHEIRDLYGYSVTDTRAWASRRDALRSSAQEIVKVDCGIRLITNQDRCRAWLQADTDDHNRWQNRSFDAVQRAQSSVWWTRAISYAGVILSFLLWFLSVSTAIDSLNDPYRRSGDPISGTGLWLASLGLFLFSLIVLFFNRGSDRWTKRYRYVAPPPF